MPQPAPSPVSEDNAPPITLPEQQLASDITHYLDHLALHHARTPLTLTIKIHPLNIAEGLTHEFAAHERELAAGEKGAAHEFADPWHPLENAVVRHELCNLLAEMTAPLAEATLAHYLLFLITIGKDLPPPYAADDHLALCASFDSKRGCMRQRFAPQQETAPPPWEPHIEAGMTVICEPLETGYYRIPDDDRHRSATRLLMSDSLYHWTGQAVVTYHLLLANYQKLGPDEREGMMQLARQVRSLFRLLAISHEETISFASLGGFNWALLQVGLNMRGAQQESSTKGTSAGKTYLSKIIRGRYASPGGSVNARNVEHRVATQILERNRAAFHHPKRHAHVEGTAPQPE